MKYAALAITLLSGPALAGTCPEAPDHSAALAALVADANAAQTAAEGQAISDRMWELWTDAPDETAQAILTAGMTRRQSFDLLGARAEFDRLVDYCPDYAEGYNQRAFVNYLRFDYEAAVADLDRALELSPGHVAALSGKALTLMALNRFEEARVVLQAALALNPWIPERGLAAPGGPLEPVGEDI